MIPELIHAANCPVGGNFACTCGAEEEAGRKLLDAVNANIHLSRMTPKELVDLALAHMPEMPLAYEMVVEELCTRVHPNWSNEDPTAQETPDERCKHGNGEDCAECAKIRADRSQAKTTVKHGD